jgi:hypothetical protein
MTGIVRTPTSLALFMLLLEGARVWVLHQAVVLVIERWLGKERSMSRDFLGGVTMDREELLEIVAVKEEELRALYRQLYATAKTKKIKHKTSKLLLETVFDGVPDDKKNKVWMSLAAVWANHINKATNEQAQKEDCFLLATRWMKSGNYQQYADLGLTIHDVTMVFQFLKDRVVHR